MTSADPSNEQVAQRLAARGRDALVERLRHAYTQAAEVHADVLSVDDDRLETIVQGAADRADGLQWRRALADVASGELGIPLTDALAHPAIARAQELAGAPSYEDSLAALGRRQAPQPPGTASRNGANFQPGVQAEPATEPSPDAEAHSETVPEPDAEPQSGTAPEPDAEPEPQPEASPPWHSMAEPGALDAEPDPPGDVDPNPAGDVDPNPAAGVEPGRSADSPAAAGAVPAAGAEPESSEPPAPRRAGPTAPPPTPAAPMPPPPAPAAFTPTPPTPTPAPAAPTPPPPTPAASTPPAPTAPTPAPAASTPPEAEAEAEAEAIVRTPSEDPDATREWSAQEAVAAVQERGRPAGSTADSMPPQPTHVVPAPVPLPPETAAGGHVPNRDTRMRPSEPPAEPGWEPAEPDYPDTPGSDEPEDDDLYQFDGRQDQDPDRLRLTAVHLGGVAGLPTDRDGIDLRLSPHGLDIMRSDDTILGRLAWSEIDALEVPSSRVRRRRGRARLIVRTGQGDASFEVPGLSSDELQEQIAPLLARFGGR